MAMAAASCVRPALSAPRPLHTNSMFFDFKFIQSIKPLGKSGVRFHALDTVAFLSCRRQPRWLHQGGRGPACEPAHDHDPGALAGGQLPRRALPSLRPQRAAQRARRAPAADLTPGVQPGGRSAPAAGRRRRAALGPSAGGGGGPLPRHQDAGALQPPLPGHHGVGQHRQFAGRAGAAAGLPRRCRRAGAVLARPPLRRGALQRAPHRHPRAGGPPLRETAQHPHRRAGR
mmetsp:Transcript_9638/g.22500  ORF Transcript_9638/g.22500 Transcript_9638/m.22500 type:complete len:230 (+) Transcript_9638:3-692(+)